MVPVARNFVRMGSSVSSLLLRPRKSRFRTQKLFLLFCTFTDDGRSFHNSALLFFIVSHCLRKTFKKYADRFRYASPFAAISMVCPAPSKMKSSFLLLPEACSSSSAVFGGTRVSAPPWRKRTGGRHTSDRLQRIYVSDSVFPLLSHRTLWKKGSTRSMPHKTGWVARIGGELVFPQFHSPPISAGQPHRKKSLSLFRSTVNESHRRAERNPMHTDFHTAVLSSQPLCPGVKIVRFTKTPGGMAAAASPWPRWSMRRTLYPISRYIST